MRSARALAMAVAVAAIALLLASGPGTRLGAWPWQAGIALLRWATYLGLGAAAVSLVVLVLALVPRWRAGVGIAAVALGLGLAAATPPLLLLAQARRVPPIHDITTDTIDPPDFVALLETRRQAPNGFRHGGAEIAAQQRKAYPDIQPLTLGTSPRETVQRALEAARAMGWEVALVDPVAGRIEATATTTWFGFRDDVVIRVRPNGPGSRVDVRSMSRVGRSDLGANARRVRELLARLA